MRLARFIRFSRDRLHPLEPRRLVLVVLLSLLSLLYLLSLLTASLAASAFEDPEAVTASNLATVERFWPYHVTLVETWRPAGHETPLRVGSPGILIRVDASERARVDFGSAGKYDVPIVKTDLVASANRIRRGDLEKSIPNFTYAIGTRLVDTGAEALTGLGPASVADRPGFLCVFADPDSEEFPALAAALAPLRDRNDVLTILFPQGAHPDARTHARLRSLGWTVPFVYDFLSEFYTSTLLADATPMPTLLLQTNEGRVVFEGAWNAGAVPPLTVALDRAFPGTTPAISSTGAPR